ncbi:MAG: hypothetical protein IH977_13805 [Nitrospinae bacterium]|nr:hypothetical protein [Nitrospinota bacterium]
MIVNQVSELTIVDVLNRAVPNRECIALSAEESVNLGQFGIMLGLYSPQNGAIPFLDHLFWFGNGFIKRGDWLFVYTGSGTPVTTKGSDGFSKVYSIYWGKPNTVFANTNIVPILFRVDAVNLFPPPENVAQLGKGGLIQQL